VVLTAGVTKLMLSGSAEVRHISMVRMRTDTNQPARVLSRFGIYLPEDRTASPAPVTLTKRDTSAAAWITPFTIDPGLITGNVALRDTKYEVPIQGEDAGESVEVGIPFRSTLKKLQADWTGDAGGRLSGKPILVADERRILGKLVNNTGRDLRDVLMVFRDPLGSENPRLQDQVIYLRVWTKGSTIDLSDLWIKGKPTIPEALLLPLTSDVKRGSWSSAQKWIFDELRSSGLTNPNFDDSDREYRRSFPIVSLFDSMTPMTNTNQNTDRVEILRRGVRGWEVSGPLGAGAMVILAHSANDDIPLPMEVDGEKPQASGRTFFQFIMPLDLSQVSGPTTQPTQ
jgi:hypothetical protein